MKGSQKATKAAKQPAARPVTNHDTNNFAAGLAEQLQKLPTPLPATAAALEKLMSPALHAKLFGPQPVGSMTAEPSDLEDRPPVNRKKAKRRAKIAEKAAAKAALNGSSTNGRAIPSEYTDAIDGPSAESFRTLFKSVAEAFPPELASQAAALIDQASKQHDELLHQHPHVPTTHTNRRNGRPQDDYSRSRRPVPPNDSWAPRDSPYPDTRAPQNGQIWNTSSDVERQRIKDFWLDLSASEQTALVKVEKGALLKKMKEVQRNNCSCTVCGRRRNAVEEELTKLFEQFYLELEDFTSLGRPPMMDGAGRHHYRELTANGDFPQPMSARIENVNDDPNGSLVEFDDEDEEYSDDGDLEGDDEYSDDEPESVRSIESRGLLQQFLDFGSSLIAEDGHLTVHHDTLRDRGCKIIDTVCGLSMRRSKRAELAMLDRWNHREDHHAMDGYDPPDPPGPLVRAGEHISDEESVAGSQEDDSFDSQEGEYDDESDDEETIQKSRMLEGRRMFQIFAARMFELNIVTAYRAHVADQRQKQLVEEEEAEKRAEEEAKTKKAADAALKKQKAKDKKAAVTAAKALKEEKAAAVQKARLDAEAAKQEEARRKAAEKKKEKDAKKKAEDDERIRKEAERQRRAQELKDKQAEQDRKAREAREKEKAAREEARLQDKAAKDEAKQREKEARERKEKAALERDEQRAAKQREKDAAAAELERKQREEQKAARKAAAAKAAAIPVVLPSRPAQQQVKPPSVPAQAQQATVAGGDTKAAASKAGPAPALPKVPVAMRSRQTSQQEHIAPMSRSDSHSGSGPSTSASPHLGTPQFAATPVSMALNARPNLNQYSNPGPPMAAAAHGQNKYVTMPLTGNFGHSQLGLPTPPGLHNPLGPAYNTRYEPHMPPMQQGFRPPPPGMGGMQGIPPPNRGFNPPNHPPPGFAPPPQQQQAMPMPFMPEGQMPPYHNGIRDFQPQHTRQSSGGREAMPAPIQTPSLAPAAPIGRPEPIRRPGSTVQGQTRASPQSKLQTPPKIKDEPKGEPIFLGSKALLDDDDLIEDPYTEAAEHLAKTRQPTIHHQAPAGPYMNQPLFGTNSFNSNVDPAVLFQSSAPHSTWNTPAGPSTPGFGSMPPPPGLGFGGGPSWAASPIAPFAAPMRQTQARSIVVRKLLASACLELRRERAGATTNGISHKEDSMEGFATLTEINEKIAANPYNTERHPDDHEITSILDTEGNQTNGGGTFDIRLVGQVRYIRWTPDDGDLARLDAERRSQRASLPTQGPIGAALAAVTGSPSTGSPSFLR